MLTRVCSRTLSAFAISTALVAFACGGSDSGSEPDDTGTGGGGGTPATPLPEDPPPDFSTVTPVTETEVGAALGGLCSVYLACDCAGAESLTEADCQTQFDSLATTAVTEAGGTLTYDGACVARVVAAFEYLGCVTETQALAHFGVLLAASELDSCKMYYGEKVLGEACVALTGSNGDDCRPALDCVDGVCTPSPLRRSAGELCAGQDDCAPGLVCAIDAVDSATEECTALPALGDPCLFDVVCVPGTVCSADGECVALPVIGEACAETSSVFDRTCEPNAQCVDGTCAPLPRGGQPCADGACAPGFTCQADTCDAQAPAICTGGPFPLFPES